MSRFRRAVVWVADDQVTEGMDYGVRLVERLQARSLHVTTRCLTSANGQIPVADLHILSGGGTSVNDKSGWMRAALKMVGFLVDGAHRGEHLVLGVCLGCQMLAEVSWPGCVRGGERIEVGLTEVRWQVNGADSTSLVVPAFHYEHVDRLTAEEGGRGGGGGER